MPDRPALSTRRLLVARSRARAGLLVSAAAAIAVAVATVCVLQAGLQRSVGAAGTPAPPGVSEEQLADEVAAGTAALLSAAPALVLLVAILAATATAQLGRLIAAAREYEWATVRARGLSHGQAWVTDAAEAAAVALSGGVIGLVLAAGLLWATGGTPAEGLAQLAAGGGAALVLGIVLAVSLRRGSERRGAGRGARATTGALVVVVLMGAALVVWQLPQARPAGFDPIVAVAPAVLLLAGALLALAVFGALSAATAAPAAAAPGVEPSYPARQVARRLPIYAVAVLLVSLTVAQAVFASAYASTWTAAATASSAVRAGADLRVDMTPQSATPSTVATAADVDGVDAAAPALVAGVEFGDTEAELVAVPARAIDTLVTTAEGVVDTAELAASVSPGDATVVAEPADLGDAATGLRVSAALQSTGPKVVDALELLAIVVDATGASAQLRLEGEATDSPGTADTITAEAELPEGASPWSLLSVSAFVGPTNAIGTLTVEVGEVEAIGGEPLDVSGEGQLSGNAREVVLWLADGGVTAGIEAPLEGEEADAAEADLPPVRAAVTTALAQRIGLAVGDVVEFRYAGTGRRGAVEVGSVEDVIPGASTTLAVFAPLDVLQVSMLQRGTSIVPPSSVWAAGDTSAAPALSAELGDRPVFTAEPSVTAQVVGALVPGWWVATAGSAVLSLIAAFAIVQTLALSRRRELGVLRALGLTPGRQARMRAAELAGVLGAAVVLGAAAGVLVAWLAVPDLVRAVTPGILPVGAGVSFAWPPLVVALVALVVGLCLIVGAAASGVRRAAATATVGEESR